MATKTDINDPRYHRSVEELLVEKSREHFRSCLRKGWYGTIDFSLKVQDGLITHLETSPNRIERIPTESGD